MLAPIICEQLLLLLQDIIKLLPSCGVVLDNPSSISFSICTSKYSVHFCNVTLSHSTIIVYRFVGPIRFLEIRDHVLVIFISPVAKRPGV